MGEMAAGIAHEVNQPLTAIASYTQACRRRLESGRADSEKLLELMEKVNGQALRAGDVIRRLCAMVKKRESHQEQADINDLVQESVTMARVDTRLLDCPIQIELNPLLPKVIADPVQIQQILLNLIRNGVDAMETVPASAQHLGITTSLRDDEYVEVAVTDCGVGLSNQVAEQLFSPFFTTKSSGMGMGLAICRSIITSQGGRLWFTRNRHGGVTFHFTVPIAM
jgi:two-component system sensor kinase FixL